MKRTTLTFWSIWVALLLGGVLVLLCLLAEPWIKRGRITHEDKVENFDQKEMEELVKDYVRTVKKWPEDRYYLDYPLHKNSSGHYIVEVVHRDDVEDRDFSHAGKSIWLELDLVNKVVVEEYWGQ